MIVTTRQLRMIIRENIRRSGVLHSEVSVIPPEYAGDDYDLNSVPPNFKGPAVKRWLGNASKASKSDPIINAGLDADLNDNQMLVFRYLVNKGMVEEDAVADAISMVQDPKRFDQETGEWLG